MKLYAIKDRNTGKLVTGITSPSHKFWERKQTCKTALGNYLRHLFRYDWQRYLYAVDNYKVVAFKLKEVEE